MSSLDATSSDLSSGIYPKVNAAQKMQYLMMNIARSARNIIILEDEGQMLSNKQGIDKDLAEFQKALEFVRTHVVTDEGRRLAALVDEQSKAYFAFTSDVVALGLKNQNVEGQRLLFGPRYKTQGELLATLQQLVALFEGQMRTASEQAHATYVTSATILGVSASRRRWRSCLA
jgi:methyl-accepting chemotaxis protein